MLDGDEMLFETFRWIVPVHRFVERHFPVPRIVDRFPNNDE
jgi:hypothetical protein